MLRKETCRHRDCRCKEEAAEPEPKEIVSEPKEYKEPLEAAKIDGEAPPEEPVVEEIDVDEE